MNERFNLHFPLTGWMKLLIVSGPTEISYDIRTDFSLLIQSGILTVNNYRKIEDIETQKNNGRYSRTEDTLLLPFRQGKTLFPRYTVMCDIKSFSISHLLDHSHLFKSDSVLFFISLL